ncbi:hypothetical protein HQ560_18610, partial [bacterium]|nr:hypothetical protein [bacterium]
TDLSRHLATQVRDLNPTGEWRRTSLTDKSFFGFLACGHMPVTLIDFASFKTLYEPVLTEGEFRKLLQLSLQREHGAAIDRLVGADIVEPYERLTDRAAKREFLERKFPHLWSVLVQNSSEGNASAK